MTTPGYYTVCVKDGVGNTYLAYQYVELWKDLWSLEPFDSSFAENYEGSMKDLAGEIPLRILLGLRRKRKETDTLNIL